MTSICDLSTKLPALVATLLDTERKLKKGRFREETLTDVVTASLAAFAGPDLVLEYPDEPTTGGDLDLHFFHAATGHSLNVRLQAKRLNAETKYGKAGLAKHRAYDELLHAVPSAGAYQFQTLLGTAGSHVPLYMFYNHASVVSDAEFSGKSPAVSGINLAFAHDVAGELITKLAAMPKRLHHKRLSHLRRHFFGLSAILCPPGKWDAEVPPPALVYASLRERWLEPSGVRKEDNEVTQSLRRILEPLALSGNLLSSRRPTDGPAIRLSREVTRPTVTFISGRTGDERTPNISN